MTDNRPAAEPQYVVHVHGPDDVLPQPDRATAYKVAHAINADILAMGEESHNSPYSPTVWAVVCRDEDA